LNERPGAPELIRPTADRDATRDGAAGEDASAAVDAAAAAAAAAVDALEATLGVRFNERRLLLRALTHRSWINEHDEPGAADNERLEFLGDALIDFVAGDYLFRNLPEAQEGELTVLRARLVKEPTLARIAADLGMGAVLRLGRGEIQGGGRERPAILCDVFEAVVGALYIDRGYDLAFEATLRWMMPEIERVLGQDRAKDPKSTFQERVQAARQITPHYETVAESGPDHDKRFEVEVSVGDEVWATGEGRSKAGAARDAARRALEAWDQAEEAEGHNEAAASTGRA